MMKNLYQQNTRRSNRSIVSLIALTAIVTIFGVDYISDGIVRSVVRNSSAVALSSVALAGDAISDYNFFTTHKALQDENERLRGELELTTELASRMSAILQENEALREMARLASHEGTGITVPVLSSFRSSLYGTFVIGSGKDQGVQRGSVVLTPGGYVLGAVSSLDGSTATVQGAFAPDTLIQLVIGETAFEAEGRGGGSVRAEVPRDALVQVGDVVLAPQFGSRPVGIVSSIDTETSNAVSILYIRVPLNLETLRFAYVIPHP